jgi:hypothetical protein
MQTDRSDTYPPITGNMGAHMCRYGRRHQASLCVGQRVTLMELVRICSRRPLCVYG